MEKRIICLIILTIVTVASFSGLLVLQDGIRSCSEPFTPYTMMDSETEGFIMADGETNPYLLIDSAYSVYATVDGRSNCDLSVSFSDNAFGPYSYLKYDYWTMKDVPVPEGSVMEYRSDTESRYTYTDPLTNTKLTFYVNGHLPVRIDFEGSTAREHDGRLERISFEIHVDYETDLMYVNGIIRGEVPDKMTLNISGTENGADKDGTVTVQPLSSTMYQGGGYVFAVISISVPGTSMPDGLTKFHTTLRDDYSFGKQDSRVQYLTADGTYVDQITSCILTPDDDGYKLTLTGKIVSSKLDSGFNILSAETLTFHYEVA